MHNVHLQLQLKICRRLIYANIWVSTAAAAIPIAVQLLTYYSDIYIKESHSGISTGVFEQLALLLCGDLATN